MDEVDACGNNEIIAAARDRDWNRVRELLKKGADVRNCNCFGQNALFFAVLNCRFELADELYQRGARLSGLIDNPDSEMLAGIADMMRYGRMMKTIRWRNAAATVITIRRSPCSNGLLPMRKIGRCGP